MEGTTATALQRAAKAWNDLNNAEGQIARLNRFTNLNSAMKADRTRFSQIAGDARRTLNSVLSAKAAA
jgi:hypothetical protein